MRIEDLQRGDYIPPSVIAQAMRVDLNDNQDYRLAQLQLRDEIMRRLSRHYGYDIPVKQEGLGLRVLGNAETNHYCGSTMGKTILKKTKRLVSFLEGVQLHELTKDERDYNIVLRNKWGLNLQFLQSNRTVEIKQKPEYKPNRPPVTTRKICFT